jgi:hypothetical protein
MLLFINSLVNITFISYNYLENISTKILNKAVYYNDEKIVFIFLLK